MSLKDALAKALEENQKKVEPTNVETPESTTSVATPNPTRISVREVGEDKLRALIYDDEK